MAKGKKSNAVEKAISKEIRRIRQFVTRATKRGFIFPQNIIPTMPKRGTQKTIERLKNLTATKLYEKAKYIRKSGEVVSGKRGRELERIQSARKGIQTRAKNAASSKSKDSAQTQQNLPHATDVILRFVEEALARWTPPVGTAFYVQIKTRDKNILQRMLEGAIRDEGRDTVARRLEANAVAVYALVEEILYGSGGGDIKEGGTGRSKINADLVRFSAILMGRPLTIEESKEMTELVEEFDFVE